MTRNTMTSRTARRASVAAAAVVAFGGLSACSSESAGEEAGAVTTSDLQNIEDQIGALDERLGALEEGIGDVGAGVGEGEVGAGDEAGLFDDPQSFLGQEVTISAEVSEQFTTTDVGSAFRIAGESGEAISVVSAGPVAELDANDVVQVSGTVVQVQRDTFEEDFGIADDELFEDPEGFFADEEGELAIAADQIRVTQEAAGN